MNSSVSEAQAIASTWLTAFSDALVKKDPQGVASSFLPNGWLRDSLVFCWNSRALEGHEKITEYLKNSLPASLIGHVALDERAGIAPSFYPVTPGLSGVEVAFTFESPVITGRGFARLIPKAQGADSWKALTVYMAVDNIKGHEELDHELGLFEGHTLSWEEVRAERRARVEKDPQVLIIGAGQTGVQVAARFRQMGIRTIVIEKNVRVGDNWRKRYPTLTLHTPRSHHNLLYAPFPSTWPTFTPRDKVAAWLEQYAESQDLIIWNSSYPMPGPTYDESSKRWAIIVNKEGTEITLHPAHIVVATGTLGDPLLPSIPSLASFSGTALHASTYTGGQRFAGKRVLVVGAGNTSADMCQDLVARGAAEVTMLQRSATCVVSAALVGQQLKGLWPEGVPVDVSDFKAAAMPLGLLKKITIAEQEKIKEFDQKMHEGLIKSGLKLTSGPEGAGQLLLVFERAGGYWIDVGAADLIADGKVKIKSGVEVAQFKEWSVTFTDDSELGIDAVIFATGYHNIRPSVRKLFGDDIIDRTHEVWGMDDEGELKGCYRPSGQPGLWFAAGDFFNSRYMSKQLALLIKSEELGLTSSPNLSSISL